MELGAVRNRFSDFHGFFQRRLGDWLDRRIPPSREIVLNHHTIFILPNRQGLTLGVVLVLMFIGAVNYEANLAFGLAFLLTGLFLLSIFHTFRNLAGLRVSAVHGDSVFAGEKAEITVVLRRQDKRTFEALQLSFPGSSKITTDLYGKGEARENLYVPAPCRGLFSPGRLTLETVFPFGICRAWSLVDPLVRCLVYPKPVACDLAWITSHQSREGRTDLNAGNDDFYGLREYRQGDPLRHVAWKNFARGQGMFVKQFSSHVDDRTWLDWEMFPGMDTEGRLSRLCYCVLRLDGAAVDYGLRLPGVEIPPSRGEKHYRKVLETLALYSLEPESPP